MRNARRLISSTVASLIMLAPLSCGLPGPLDAFGHGDHVHAHGGGKAGKREIPLSPGVPKLGQAPLIPKDPAVDGKTAFTLVYTNDIHSRVDPFPTDYYYTLYKGKGGFARLSTAIRDLKAKNPATIAVDSGDYLQGTPYFNFFKGETEMRLMQAAGFDVITVGNHEFDNGVDGLMKVVPHFKGDIITTNMTFTPEIAKRYTVKKVGNVRVGFFGLITEVNGLISAPLFKGARYYDPIKVAKATVAKMKKECDVVVLLSHMGTVPPYAEEDPDGHDDEAPITDEALAKAVSGIDVIISGHTHVMIKRPKVIRNGAHRTHIVSSGMGGGFLGKADVTIDRGRVVNVANEMVPMTASVPTDGQIETLIRPYRAQMDSVVKEKIGQAAGTFRRYGTKDTESALNNLIADSTLAAARTVRPQVDFAVMSSGTPRNHISEGVIHVEDVYYALPFDNKIVIMEVTGKQALEMLTIQRRPTDNKRHAIANASYTLLQNAGPIKDVFIDGKPLDLNAKYVVAVNDYMAEGSSGFTMLPGAPRQDTGILQRDALIKYIRAKGTVTPDANRIKLNARLEAPLPEPQPEAFAW